MKQKLFTLLLAIMASFGTIFAESGTCGTNLTWTLDDEGTLTISGTGAMADYPFSKFSGAPWRSKSIKNVVILDGVTSIGDNAFYYCSGLTSVSIPNSVTSIGRSAFNDCTGLTSVTIPNSVTSIGDYAFSDCSGLTSIIVENGNSFYDSRNNCNAIIETATNTLIVGCMNTIIPNSVTSIGRSAFNGCYRLTSITIPNSVTSIGEGAFYDCTGLTSVTIPNRVTSIEKSAFGYCKNLTSVTIGNSVTSIGDYAFDYCRGLTSVTIPNSVTSIGGGAFSNCTSLTSVIWNAKNCADFASNNTPFYDLRSQITSFTFGNEVEHIPANLCYGMSNLTSVTIPNSVTSIGWEAFEGCSGLTSVTIPNSVTSIGNYAFYNCSGLTSVTIPNSVTSIGNYAFYNCSGLASITIPNSVTSIGYNPFTGCTSLPIEDNIRYADTYLVEATDTTLSSYTIKEETKWIGTNAFDNCPNLKTIYNHSNISLFKKFKSLDVAIVNYNNNTVQFTHLPLNENAIYDVHGNGVMSFLETTNKSQETDYTRNIIAWSSATSLPDSLHQVAAYSRDEIVTYLNSNNDGRIDMLYFYRPAKGETKKLELIESDGNGYVSKPIDAVYTDNYSNESIHIMPLDADLNGRTDFYSYEGGYDHFIHYRQPDGSYLKVPLNIITDTTALDSTSRQYYNSEEFVAYKHNIIGAGSCFVMVGHAGFGNFASIDMAIDIDRNGLVDLVSSSNGAMLYNIGNNNFIPSQAPGRITIKDMNNDGITDYIIYNPSAQTTSLQINSAEGQPTTLTLMQNLTVNNIWCYDFDNDGDVDILCSLDWTSSAGYAYLVFFRNDGNNTFKRVENAFDNPAKHFKFVDCRDVDNDGKYEILAADSLINYDSYERKLVKGDYYIIKYNNQLKTSYSEEPFIANSIPSTSGISTLTYIKPVFGDFNNDGIMDYWYQLGGDSTAYSHFTPLSPNSAPQKMSVPTINLDTVRQMLKVSWALGTDAESSAPDLTYNLRIGTAAGLSDIWYAPVNADGKQRTIQGGKAGSNLSQWVNVSDWNVGDYYIAVQAVDPNGLGGAWSDELVYHHRIVPSQFTISRYEAFTVDSILVRLSSSINAQYTYNWNFGDSAIVLGQNGQDYYIAYNTAGKKVISLQVIAEDGTVSAITQHTIQIYPVMFLNRGTDSYGHKYFDMNMDGTLDAYYYATSAAGFYRGNGDGSFTKLAKLYNSNISEKGAWMSFLDYNMDGMPDVYRSATQGNIIVNQGDFDLTFLDVTYDDTSLPDGCTWINKNNLPAKYHPNAYESIYICKDLNNDGLTDVISKYIYIQKPDGSFEQHDLPILNLLVKKEYCAADINNDGYLDLIFIQDNSTIAIYTGDADYNFSLAKNIHLAENWSLSSSSSITISAVRDYDNNGYVDITIDGHPEYSSAYKGFTILMYPNFEYTCQWLPGKSYPFIDLNGDTVPDLDRWYMTTRITNQTPAVPQNLRKSEENNAVVLEWDAAVDRETPVEQMRYNISVKKKDAQVGQDSAFIVSPMNGLRDEAAIVPDYPYFYGTRMILPYSLFETGKEYEFQIQSIDLWNTHSPMSSPLTFSVEKNAQIIKVDTIIITSISGDTMLTSTNRQIVVEATIEPDNALNQDIEWSLWGGEDKVTIEPNGKQCVVTLKEGATNGDFYLFADAMDGSYAYGYIHLMVDLNAVISTYYTIRFLNYDGTELQTVQVLEGEMPVYNGAAPVRPEDENYTYTFNGWDPTIVTATANADYTAQYTATAIPQPTYYTIDFLNWNGAVLQTVQVLEGEMPVFTGATPTKPEDEQYTYAFNGWSPTIVPATADTYYYAQYTATKKPIEPSAITVRLDPTSATAWNNVYLFAWNSNGEALTGNWPGTKVTQDANGWWAYTFPEEVQSVNIIWNSGNGNQTMDIMNVTSSDCFALESTSGTQLNVILVDCSTVFPHLTYYTIRFLNYDGTELQSSQVLEGEMPVYSGATPVRPEEENYTYTFNGWNPTIVAATANADYIAQYTAIEKTVAHTIPTAVDLTQAGYDVVNNVVLCLQFTGEATICYDIVLAGNYNNWNTTPANMLKMQPLAGFEGWYAAEFPYRTTTDDQGNIVYPQAKPVQLKSDGSFSWDCQSGDVGAWTLQGGKEAYVVQGFNNEADVYYPVAGAYIYGISYWKNHYTPCVVVPKHNYTIHLYAPNACAEMKPAILGSFNNWETGISMTEQTDVNQRTYYTYTVYAEKGTEYKFREASSTDWSNELYQYYEEYSLWAPVSNFVLPVTAQDITIVHDFSDNSQYRFHLCEGIDTAIEVVDAGDSVLSDMPQKILVDGQIFILRGDKTYTITGQEVR